MKITPVKTITNVIKQTSKVSKSVADTPIMPIKSGELPRFSSPEMVMARVMNKIALHQTKVPKIFTFPKASIADLKRLTSQTIEDSYKRVTWTNPKDGEIYHILKEGELKDGSIKIRILNEDGSFLKNANITPKKIIIVDGFNPLCSPTYGVSHGKIVTTFLKRNNPFADIETIDVGLAGSGDKQFFDAFKQILQRIKSGEKIDYVSCSKGGLCYSTSKNLRGNPEYQPITDIAKSGTRLLFASGNARTLKDAKTSANQVLLLADNIEGVGSISPKTHELSYFSAGRNSFFTQHYETGEHYLRLTPYGVNITGIPGTDMLINGIEFNQNTAGNILIGKSQKRVKRLLDKINYEIKEILNEKYKPDNGRIDFNKMCKLEQRQMSLERRRAKLIQMRSSLNLNDGVYETKNRFFGTSYSTPVRTAKLSLNDTLEGII